MFLLLLSLLALGAALVVGVAPAFEGKTPTVIGLILVGCFFLVVSQVAIVGTKKVGVVTTFNKPVANMDNGIHHKWPWQKVHEMDGAIQTDNHLCKGDRPVDSDTGIAVRIGNQSVACLDVTIRWRIRQVAAEALYRDYRGFDHVRDSLVTRDLHQSLNDVFTDYNPLANVNTDSPSAGPSLETLSKRTRQELIDRVGDQIEVLSVFIPIVHHDKQTQTKINQYQAAKADTRIAQQRVQTAIQEAEANKRLAASISKEPDVLVSKCLDLVKTGVDLPAGFTCWPGGGSGVVIPSAKP